MNNIYEKEKALLKSKSRDDIDEVLAKCTIEDKDELIRMLVARMNGGLIRP